MNYKKLIVKSGLRMFDSNLTVGTWGNISARNPLNNKVYVTPSAMDYSKIDIEDVVVCDLEGNILEGEKKPTIEKDLHLEIYKKRSDVNAVVHTHPIFSTVFSCMGEDIPLIIDEAAQMLGKTCLHAEYALPGSMELAENCVKALGDDGVCCLLQSHGAVCVGADMDEAFKVAAVLEMTAEIYYRVRAAGGSPIPISDENIAFMRDFMKNHYRQ